LNYLILIKKQSVIKVYFGKFVKIYLKEYRIVIERKPFILYKVEKFSIEFENFKMSRYTQYAG